MAEWKLKYLIDADNRRAAAAFKEIDTLIDRTAKRMKFDAVAAGIGAGITASITNSLQQLPRIFKQQVDEMIQIAEDRQNAFKGLESITNSLRIDSGTAQESVRNLRLVKAGIVEVGDASIAVKNLLSSGFSLPESIKLFEAFSDTAAFGKSAALDFGEAIRGATEGVRNGNSVLVDNVGLTKNLSAILKDAGFAEQDLSRVKQDSNVRQALYNGLLKEAIPQMGDANKLTQGWTGTTSALTTAQKNLYAATGDVIINNKDLLALIKVLTGEVNTLTSEVEKSGSTWNKTVDGMTSTFAEFVLEVRVGINKEIADLQELINWIERTGNAFGWLGTVGPGMMARGSGGRFEPYEYYNDQLGRNQRLTGTYRQGALNEEQRLRREFQFQRGIAGSPYTIDPNTFTMVPKTSLPGGGGPSSANAGGGAGGGRLGAATPRVGDAMLKFFEQELGLTVTSAGRTPGRTVAGTGRVSLHSVRPYQAVDVRVNDIKDFMRVGNQEMFERVARAIEAGYRFVEERDKKGSPHGHFESRRDAKASAFESIHTGKNYFTPEQLAYLQQADQKRIAGTTEGKFMDFASERIRAEAEANQEIEAGLRRLADEMIEEERRASSERLDIRRAEAELAVEIIGHELEQGYLTEKEAFEQLAQLKLDMLEDERQEVAGLIQTRETQHQLDLLDLQIQKQAAANARDRLKLEKQISDELQKQLDDAFELFVLDYKRTREAEAEASERARAASEAGMATARGTWLGSLAGGTGTELVDLWETVADEMGNAVQRIKSEADYLKDIYADVKDFAGSAIGSMIDGLTQMAVAWIVTGEGSAKAALQMMAATALSIAFQATIKAIFEAAEAAAAYARYDFYAAAMHTAAAQMYINTAVIAGAAGVGMALGARALGGGKKGGKGGGRGSDDSYNPNYGANINKNPDPYSRESSMAYYSGRDRAIDNLSRSLDRFTDKVDSMKPGEVIVRGVQEKRGLVSDTVIKEISSAGKRGPMGRALGLR